MSDLKNEDEKPSGCLVAFLFVAFLPGMWWTGYAISTMWKWFLVPLGAPQVGVAHALGIVALLGYMRTNNVKVVEKQDTEWTRRHYLRGIGVLLLGPALALGMGRLYLWLGTL